MIDINYAFNADGILVPQRIQKCHLAFFYGRHPRSFRRELEKFIYISDGWYYTKQECTKIFAQFGEITAAEVEAAKPRIADYFKQQRKRLRERYLGKIND